MLIEPMRTTLLGIGVVGLVLLAIVFGRTVALESRQVPPVQADSISVRGDAPKRLAGSIQHPTITKRDPSNLDSTAYQSLYTYLERRFPRVHQVLDTVHVNGLSRLYTWRGTDSSLAPIVLMAHVDVVPIEADTAWTHPPFGATIDNGYVWGRGTLDDKSSAVGILEAIATLLRDDLRPTRTVHVAFGHDEEVGGRRGGGAIADTLLQSGSSPALVVDEGGAVTKGALSGLDRPLAVVGVAEKGYLSVELRASGKGGHSSAPPEQTSIEALNEALSRLLADPLPSRLDGVMGRTLDYVAPEMGPAMRGALANRWLTAPALRWTLNQSPATRAAIRTVQVPTRLDAGVKDNVVPTEARAVVNYRILPSHSVDRVLGHVRSAAAELPVTIDMGQTSPPVPPSAVGDSTFRLLQRTVHEATTDSVVVAPYLVPGATDSRYYADATEHVYRFVPYTLTPQDRSRIHGPNERISLADYRTVVRYYARLIQTADELPR